MGQTKVVVRLFCVTAFLLLAARSVSAAIAIDATTFKDLASASTTITTPAFSTTAGNELLLAFVSADYLPPATNTKVNTVTGGGLTWVLVVRTNVQSGTSEIWRAFAPSPLTTVTVTATLSQSVSASMTVMSFTGVDTTGVNGAGAIGATASANAASGAPSATLVTTRNNSWVFGVGTDYDNPIARTPGAGQSLIHQYFPPVGDTYWVQKQNSVAPLAGTSVTINDTAPTTDRFNLSICEILPAPVVPTFDLSGTITPASIGGGAAVALSGAATATVMADSYGNYTFTALANGAYTVMPSKTGFGFTPASQSVTINGAPVPGVNFTAQSISGGISGTISPASLGSGATVSLPGAAISTIADSFGHYAFTGLPDGTYTVNPSKSGYVFTPINRSVTVAGTEVAGVDFTIQADTGWSISGTISPAAGAGLVTLSGPTSGTVYADFSGNYTFSGLTNGSYTVTPSNGGYSYNPGSRSVTVSGASVAGVNFAAQPWTGSISGAIGPVSVGNGATVTLSGALSRSVTADSSGNYTFAGLPDGAFTVTPTSPYYSFTPASRSATVTGGAAVSGIDFTGALATTTITGTVSPASDGAGTQIVAGESGTSVADSSGNYTMTLTNGTYTLYPNKPGYTFTPPNQTVTLTGEPVTVNFTATSTTTGPAAVGQWSAPFDVGMVAVNMVMMHTGKVLMFSGSFAASWTERVWDPATGNATLVPNPYYNLFCAGHSQLADGRILVVGGYDSSTLGAANANIFDPVTQSWSALPNMAYRRWYPTSTTLPDGRALITSGAQTCLTCLADVPEIFDPATNRFTTWPSARLAVPYYPFMYVLPSGKVIDAGANEDPAATSTLDLTTRTWTTVDPIVRDGHSSAMYQPGKILKSGTATDSGEAGSAAATAYVLDATQPSPAWRQVASMAYPRSFHNTTLLPDGTVLVTGGGTMRDGYDVSNAVKTAELWSPATETWKTMSSAAIPRLYHSTALLLPDGRVLTAGSGNDGPAVNQTQAEIFSPPYLFKGARPVIASAPSVISYGSTFFVDSLDAGTIASVSLIRPGAVTHAFDEDQRFLSLSFTHAPGTLNVTAPASANLAPPGYYMLFIVNNAGVPSVAAWVRFGTPAGDTESPTAPANLSGAGAVGSAALTWDASTDNTGVALYNVHRSTLPGFVPTAANRIAQPASTGFTDTGLAAGTYFYVVTAQDVSGNVSQPSVEAAVIVLADATRPAVAVTAPVQAATVSGSILVTATASDDVGVAGVQFKIDGQALGAERTSPPYSVTWNTTTASNASHVVSAVARDAAGNQSEAQVDVTVSNTSQNPAGLVAAYGFNQGSGVQVADASGQGNTGTISSATWTTTGKFGGALSFNGISAWVTVADAASLDLTTGMTIEAWVNPTSGTGWRTVVLKEGTNSLAYSLYSANNASRPAGFVHTNADQGLNGTAAVPLSAWTHLAMTYDGATLRMFVNGVQVSSRAVTGNTMTTAGALRIGGNSVWGEYYKGAIDELRIYNRALTAAEIQTDMTTPIP